MNENFRILYKILKGIYLGIQGLVLPVAVWYAVHHDQAVADSSWLWLVLYLIVPLWAVLFIGLSMYQFPLGLGGAIGVVGPLGLQIMIASTRANEPWQFSFYVAFFNSMISLMFALGAILGKAWLVERKQKTDGGYFSWYFPLMFILIGGNLYFGYALAGPLIRYLTSSTSWVLLLSFVVNTVVMSHMFLQELMSSEQLSKGARDEEWEKWILPVCLVMVASLVAALFVAGINSPANR